MSFKYTICVCFLVQLAFFVPSNLLACSASSSTKSEIKMSASSSSKSSASKRLNAERAKSNDYKQTIRQLKEDKQRMEKENQLLQQEQDEAMELKEELAAQARFYASIPKRDVAGTVVAIAPEWIVIETETGDVLSFVAERKPKENELSNSIAKTLPHYAIGNYVLLTVYKLNNFDIVSNVKQAKKPKK